ncbi:MAG: hypothetical protein ABIZ04_04140 [Opitutus sp.]
MMLMPDDVRREFRVAFSRNGQPLWFRAAKWIVIVSFTAVYWRSIVYWCVVAGLLCLGVGAHFFYRYKTDRWRRAWGGWNDLDAGR